MFTEKQIKKAQQIHLIADELKGRVSNGDQLQPKEQHFLTAYLLAEKKPTPITDKK